MRGRILGTALLLAAAVAVGYGCTGDPEPKGAGPEAKGGGPEVKGAPEAAGGGTGQPETKGDGDGDGDGDGAAAAGGAAVSAPGPIDPYLTKAIGWLVEAQHEDGGFGAGAHQRQEVRDPHAVSTDPGTTAFVGMALIRAGHTPSSGDHKDAVRRATEYMLAAVEKAPEDGPQITDLTGTQPQTKMGQYVDTSLAAQLFTRLLPTLGGGKPGYEAALEARVTAALDKCLRKIEKSQKQDGSWNHGGWASVLQSATANNALEGAAATGRPVDVAVLERSRTYQKGNFDETAGTPTPDAAGASAGVALYTVASNQRANAAEAKACAEAIETAQTMGKLPQGDIEVNQTALLSLGIEAPRAEALAKAYNQNEAAALVLSDDATLAGFGSNGGEEYLSYMMTSESLVIQGGDAYAKWADKMRERFTKVQNPDGSWSGHHCITSPVFCTAAVVLCATADRDAPFLVAAAATAAPKEK